MRDTPLVAETADQLTFRILVVPRSSRPRLGPVVGDRIKVAVSASPVDGKANAAIVALFAAQLGIRKDGIQIVGGLRSKRKTVQIRGTPWQHVLDLL